MAYQTPNITNALGKPVVEQKQDFFVLFEGAFSTAPEIIDQTSYKLTYIVDGQGNISKPAEAQPSSFNILQNYENNQNVTVILDQATTENANLAGVKKITAIGQPVPYLFSSNGIGSESYENRLVFRPIGAPPSGAYDPISSYNTNATADIDNADPTIRGYAQESNYFGLFGNLQGVLAGEAQTSAQVHTHSYTPGPSADEAVVSASSGMYQINSVNADLQELTFDISLTIKGNDSQTTAFVPNFWPNGFSFQLAIQVGDFTTNNYDVHVIDGGTLQGGYGDGFMINPPLAGIIEGCSWDGASGIYNQPADTFTRFLQWPRFRLTKQMLLDAPSDGSGKKYVKVIFAMNKASAGIQSSAFYPKVSSIFIGIGQAPLAANYFTALNPDGQSNAPSYWETASISGGGTIPNKWLTASAKLSEFYNNYYVSTAAQNNFGYADPNITFTPQPGDKIRFQYNPDNLFNIYAVKAPGENGGKLALLLDGLPETASLNNFVLYRIDNSLAADMILDVKKTVTIGDPENPFTGVILPQFPSDNIQNNLNSILEKLKAEGIVKN